MLVYGMVSNPAALWQKYRIEFCDDLPRRLERERRFQLDDNTGIIPAEFKDAYFDYRLFLLSRYLIEYGKTLEDYQLPLFTLPWDRTEGNPLLTEEYYYN